MILFITEFGDSYQLEKLNLSEEERQAIDDEGILDAYQVIDGKYHQWTNEKWTRVPEK